jgi:Flp pilus assembly protein TadD, contains TPR repeats
MIKGLLLAALLASAPVEAPPETRSLYLQLIHQARADGRTRAALAWLDDFDRRYPGDADARLLRVNALLDLGQIDAAEAVPLPADARNGSVNAVRGHLFAARQRWAEAAGSYATAAQASPADPLLRNALGYALLREGRTAQAVESFRAAVDLAPQEPVIRNNLLLALTLAGRRDEAEALLRRLDPATQSRLRRQIAAEQGRMKP